MGEIEQGEKAGGGEMSTGLKVTVIPAKKDLLVNRAGGMERKRLRVAAYARVSTNNEEQLTSY